MPRILKAKEWESSETVSHARALIGRVLVARDAEGRLMRRRIVETEAYDGEGDLACHASKGRTARTAVMFGDPGTWYVYLCYGVHEMLNLVTGPEDHAAAVLIRGVEGAIGPGRLAKTLGIDRRFNGRPATSLTGLWIEDDGWALPPGQSITAGPRVGVAYAGPVWAAKPWRFQLASERPALSRTRNAR